MIVEHSEEDDVEDRGYLKSTVRGKNLTEHYNFEVQGFAWGLQESIPGLELFQGTHRDPPNKAKLEYTCGFIPELKTIAAPVDPELPSDSPLVQYDLRAHVRYRTRKKYYIFDDEKAKEEDEDREYQDMLDHYDGDYTKEEMEETMRDMHWNDIHLRSTKNRWYGDRSDDGLEEKEEEEEDPYREDRELADALLAQSDEL